jgi:tRNA pseudouridine55 synthase
MDGYLLIDKPAGWTSHDVVAKVRNILKQEAGHKVKVGHTGTLDPFATGLLVLMVGSYTKRASEFSKLDKIYEAEITLGATSTTGDLEGQIAPVPIEEARHRIMRSHNSVTQIKEILKLFEGEIEQVPHKFSAIKINGQRAYKLAREGREVKIEPRNVTIYSIKNIEYDYPKLKFTTEVSSGTYIRSLAENIGEKLGTGAYLSALRRIRVGDWNIEQSRPIAELTIDKIEECLYNIKNEH